MSHKHHIIPKHAGGTDDPSNLIELTVDEHATAHKELYEQHGRWQDYVAWQGLAKLSPKEELVKILQSEGGKKVANRDSNPFKNAEWQNKFNSMRNPEFVKEQNIKANSKKAIEKKKNTFAEIKHQQKENNSQFGTVWCVLKTDINLSNRKKFNKESIPDGWITAAEWRDNKKIKNSPNYGRHWYNDGIENFYFYDTDERISNLQLHRGRLNCKFIKNSLS